MIPLNTKPWDITCLAFIWTPHGINDDFNLQRHVKFVRVAEAVQRVKMQQITCESVNLHISVRIFQIQTTCCLCNFLMFRPLIDTIEC